MKDKNEDLEEFITQSVYFDETTLLSEGVSSKVWDQYLPLGFRMIRPKGDCIIKIGDNPQGLYFINKGVVQINLLSKEDTVKTINVKTKRTIFGDQFVFHQQPGIFEAIALEDCELCFFPREKVMELAQKDFSLMLYIMKNMSITARMMAYQIADLSRRNISQNLARILYSLYCVEIGKGVKLSPITISITHKDLADIMGTHRVTITKHLNHFKELKILDFKYEKIIISDAEKLRNMATGELQ